jgi:predicted PurR-regulated permease PerM
MNDQDPGTKPAHRSSNTTRIEQGITVVILAAIVIGCYLVLAPFISALLWAVVLCCTTWPAFNRLRRVTRLSASLAGLLMTTLIALVLLAPFVFVGMTLAENANQLLVLGKRFVDEGPPEPPAWVGQIPLIGDRIQSYWAGFAHDSPALVAELEKYLEPLRSFALASGGAVAQGLLQLTLSILIAFFFYRDGEAMAARLNAGVSRIAGDHGKELVAVAVNTMRGVVYGILGTAIAQGVVAAIGFWIAGVPAATLLGLATFVLSPVPIGPPLVWFPAALWLFYHGSTGWGIFMLIWGVAVVSSVDNVIKPLIISRGSNLPFILVLLGVLGGVVAFGFIGLFLGPTLLAIGFALLRDWSAVRTKTVGAD